MFLFEKNSIGAYCNRLYDLKKGRAPFYAKAELKQTAHFFMSQNDHHLGDAINFDYVSFPPALLLF